MPVSLCAYILVTVYSSSSDPSQSDSDSKDFWFNMQALTSYLRKALDQNPTASYYNVDILKYQVGQPASGLEHKRKNDCRQRKVSRIVSVCLLVLHVWEDRQM